MGIGRSGLPDSPGKTFRTPLWRFLLRLTVTVALLGLLLGQIGLERIAASLAVFDLLYIPVVLIALGLSHFVNGLTLKISSRRISIGWVQAFLISLRSWSWGQYTPARIGEASLVYYLHDLGVPWGESAALAFLTRFLSLVFLLVIAVAGTMALGFEMTGAPWVLLLPGMALAGVVSLSVFLVWRGPGAFLGKRFERHAAGFKETLGSLLTDPLVAPVILSAQLLKLFFLFGVTKMLFSSMGGDVPYGHICVVNSVARIAALLPVSINGLGVREGIQVWLYSSFSGIEASVVIGVAVVANAVMYAAAGFVTVFLPHRGATQEGRPPFRRPRETKV